MNRIFSTLLILVLFHFMAVIDSCGDPKSVNPGYISITSISSKVSQIQRIEEFDPDIPYYERYIFKDHEKDSFLRYDSIAIHIVFVDSIYGFGQYSVKNVNKTFRGSFLSESNATSPVPPSPDYITNVSVISKNRYNENYHAGSNLSDIMLINEGDFKRNLSLPDDIQPDGMFSIDIEDIDIVKTFFLLFTAPPSEEGAFDFEIQVTLQDATNDVRHFSTLVEGIKISK